MFRIVRARPARRLAGTLVLAAMCVVMAASLCVAGWRMAPPEPGGGTAAAEPGSTGSLRSYPKAPASRGHARATPNRGRLP